MSNSGTPGEARRVADLQPTPTKWLWPGYVQLGAVTLVDGQPGASKSTLLIDLAARVSNGRKMPDGSKGLRGKVVMFSAEDDPDHEGGMRLLAADVAADRVWVVSKAIDLDREFHRLSTLVYRERPTLVTVDPISAYASTARRTVFDHLGDLAKETDCAVVVARHPRKSGGPALHAGLGSIGLIGSARAGFVLGVDPMDEKLRVLACSMMNNAGIPPSLCYRVLISAVEGGTSSKIEWEGRSPLSADQLAQSQGGDKSATTEAHLFLLDLLADGPLLVSEAQDHVQAAGLAWGTVSRERRRMGYRSSKLSKPGRRRGEGFWVWHRPEDDPLILGGLQDIGPPEDPTL